MKFKTKSIIIIIILILSILIVNWKFEFEVKGLEYEINESLSSRAPVYFDYEDYIWGQVDVISEPILGQNNNFGSSCNAKIAIENGKIYVVWDDNDNKNTNFVCQDFTVVSRWQRVCKHKEDKSKHQSARYQQDYGRCRHFQQVYTYHN